MGDSWMKKLFKASTTNNKKDNEDVISKEEIKQEEKDETVNGGPVITIGRELGSGGRKVAKLVSEKLGYKY